MKNLKIAVLVSGGGTNLQTLINAQELGELPIEIVGVISNREDAYAIERAKSADINISVLSHAPSGKRMGIKTFEKNAIEKLNDWQPDLIVLAGFMRVLSAEFINACIAPMINLHPSLLPKFKGLDTHQRAITDAEKNGDTDHGCSVHIVTAELDGGQVLTQAILTIAKNDTADSLQQRVNKLEHKILPYTIALIAKGMFNNNQLANDVSSKADIAYLDTKQSHTVAACLPELPWKLKIDSL